MSQLTVLIFTDDPEFAHMIVARWQTERTVPSFLISSEATWEKDKGIDVDLAIVGPLESDNPVEALKRIEYGFRPTLYVASRVANAVSVKAAHPRVLVLNDYEGWVNAVVLLAGEALRRVDATIRAKKAEQSVSAAQRHAMLGRYMLDMRHSLNNALTSIMGNSELLLLEPGKVSADVREQIETIHSMSMRVHEIIQRFTSLETEMSFADRQSQHEMPVGMHSFVSGD
ncbi:MAG TPA: histidine kinase dimerization/phospho-acceptor domain-containing protein [Terriglobales bacterium]|nr:histidine kinase dimerization/phospho-acceptor domain-containing protein [Terriglobales bacterium]